MKVVQLFSTQLKRKYNKKNSQFKRETTVYKNLNQIIPLVAVHSATEVYFDR